MRCSSRCGTSATNRSSPYAVVSQLSTRVGCQTLVPTSYGSTSDEDGGFGTASSAYFRGRIARRLRSLPAAVKDGLEIRWRRCVILHALRRYDRPLSTPRIDDLRFDRQRPRVLQEASEGAPLCKCRSLRWRFCCRPNK